MLMQTAQSKFPDMDTALQAGDFSILNSFLTATLRRFSSMKSSSALLEGATGHATIRLTPFISYLRNKYL